MKQLYFLSYSLEFHLEMRILEKEKVILVNCDYVTKQNFLENLNW